MVTLIWREYSNWQYLTSICPYEVSVSLDLPVTWCKVTKIVPIALTMASQCDKAKSRIILEFANRAYQGLSSHYATPLTTWLSIMGVLDRLITSSPLICMRLVHVLLVPYSLRCWSQPSSFPIEEADDYHRPRPIRQFHQLEMIPVATGECQ